MRTVPRRAPRPAFALVVAVTAILAGACGGSAGSPSSSPEASTASPPASGAVVEVKAVDYAFEPSTIALQPGPVTFRVENAGTQEHEFEIFEGDTVVDEIEGLVPGLTKDLTISLVAGSYTFVCKLADHEQRGMTGTLIVAP
jgi:iron uptake system component EfeO